jgi:hypothetical protein
MPYLGSTNSPNFYPPKNRPCNFLNRFFQNTLRGKYKFYTSPIGAANAEGVNSWLLLVYNR